MTPPNTTLTANHGRLDLDSTNYVSSGPGGGVRRMGWRDICMDDGPEGVIRAQFERFYDAEIARMENAVQQSPAVRDFIGAMTVSPDRQLAPGDTSAVIRQIAEARRVD